LKKLFVLALAIPGMARRNTLFSAKYVVDD